MALQVLVRYQTVTYIEAIQATRIELLAPPGDPVTPTNTICYRCGGRFNRHAEKVVAGAPCRDCRDVLRAEGDTTRWRA